MNATHKTFGGMMRAVDRTIAYLESNRLFELGSDEEVREYKRLDAKVDGLMGELDALWSNPADVLDAAKAKNRLNEAWHKAVN